MVGMTNIELERDIKSALNSIDNFEERLGKIEARITQSEKQMDERFAENEKKNNDQFNKVFASIAGLQSSLEKDKNKEKIDEEPPQAEIRPIFGKYKTDIAKSPFPPSSSSSSEQKPKGVGAFSNLFSSNGKESLGNMQKRQVTFENKRESILSTPAQEVPLTDEPLTDTEKFVKEAWPEALLSRDVDDDSYSSAKNKIVFRPE